MGAITWKNINREDDRGALLGLAAAGHSFNAGFDKFNDVIKQREDINAANWNQQKTNNTQAFLD